MTRSLLYCRNRGKFRSGRDFGELEEECFETRIGSEPRAQFRWSSFGGIRPAGF
jgi:hypothetical protein